MDGRLEALRYPRLARRVQAVLIDGIILAIVFFGTAVPVSSSSLAPALKIALVGLPLLALEPGLVSFTGATIGHRLQGLRVERTKTGTRLDPVRSLLRFFAKMFFGWLSLVFILLTRRHQALHDMAAGSVVVLADPAKAADGEALAEWIPEEAGFTYPAKPKRVLFILLYAILGMFLLAIVSIILVSGRCFQTDLCSEMDRVVQNLVGIVWLLGLIALIVLGWRGRLWGCRRIPRRP